MTQQHWRVIVQIGGVPAITPEEFEQVAKLIPGSIRHETGRSGGKLWLDWRFTAASCRTAVMDATGQWQAVVRRIASAMAAQCTDFRVLRVPPGRNARRTL